LKLPLKCHVTDIGLTDGKIIDMMCFGALYMVGTRIRNEFR
jgi:hypothetical protein